MSKNICVVGPVRMDLVFRAPALPRAGGTVVAESVVRHPGGTGASHAVAASRMGAQVALVGCIGDDDRGSDLRGVFTADGVDIQHLSTLERTPTGIGALTLLPSGERTLVVFPGANARLGASQVDAAAKEIRASDVLVLSNDVPREANLRAREHAKDGTRVLVHATSAEGLDKELLEGVDVLVASRAEARALVGADEDVAPAGLARRLACLGPERVVITLGREGALHFNGQDAQTFEGLPTDTVDELGAEEAFVAALAVLRAEGARLKDAVRLAGGAAALARGCEGGIPSLPTREKVEELFERTG